MKKIKTVEDLRKAKAEILAGMHGREREGKQKVLVRVHCGTSGLASGAREILDFLTHELEKRNIDAVVVKTGDMGYCYAEPTIEVTRPGEQPVVFGYVDKIRADEIIERYIKNGDYVDGILPVNYRTID